MAAKLHDVRDVTLIPMEIKTIKRPNSLLKSSGRTFSALLVATGNTEKAAACKFPFPLYFLTTERLARWLFENQPESALRFPDPTPFDKTLWDAQGPWKYRLFLLR